jgi:hypothetical protein
MKEIIFDRCSFFVIEELFFFGLKEFPNSSILNPLDFFYLSIWQCAFKAILNRFPFLNTGPYISN